MFQNIIDALIDIVLWLPRKLYEWLVDALEGMLDWIPEIQVADVQDVFNSLGGDMLYFLTMMEFDYGLTAIFTALLARFVLRRIPFIG
ncbi:DUF2523 family protein [Marinobacter zhanjiangensis]|uniref:DUF2523 domain-containing protein n=1 Tax=Marinobacter zhanjiangensis TaxID=578215 RepID=A0ABQ3B9B4_9GAMM|nr:DUF2523 family protein [Marinobacter zhanjiangensis]GGY83566.1 hypothetical protein GCM10007071_33590 [Marinobacter zhanjiangensis]